MPDQLLDQIPLSKTEYIVTQIVAALIVSLPVNDANKYVVENARNWAAMILQEPRQ